MDWVLNLRKIKYCICQDKHPFVDQKYEYSLTCDFETRYNSDFFFFTIRLTITFPVPSHSLHS